MKVTLLGSGNVATHLGKAIKAADHEVLQVWSKTKANAETLARQLGCTSTDDIAKLNDRSDLYIVSVSDRFISDVISGFLLKGKILVHTSGTTSIDLDKINGVLYPLQTFSKEKELDFDKVPLFIEAEDSVVLSKLKQFAESLSSMVIEADSAQRKTLHIAAVLACNFSNHLYALAERLLKNNHLDFDLIRPLINETASKAMQYSPATVQTGPALRGDNSIIESHLEYLETDTELKELYKVLSQSIINFYQK